VAGKKSNFIWYAFALVVALAVIGLFTDGGITGMQVARLDTASTTPLDNAVQFLRDFGFFNVVLPFLLVFAIVFGVLEKSKLFGVEKIDRTDYPRRNLNAIVAFCVAFFVVAAANITGVIQATIPQIAFVLVVIISFLLLFGSLIGEEQMNLWEKSKGLRYTFITAIFVAMALILLGGFGLLGGILDYVVGNFSGTVVTSVILVVVIVLAMWFISKKPKPKTSGGENK